MTPLQYFICAALELRKPQNNDESVPVPLLSLSRLMCTAQCPSHRHLSNHVKKAENVGFEQMIGPLYLGAIEFVVAI